MGAGKGLVVLCGYRDIGLPESSQAGFPAVGDPEPYDVWDFLDRHPGGVPTQSAGPGEQASASAVQPK